MSKTRIEINSENENINQLMENYGFTSKTETVNFMIDNFQFLQEENKSLSNQNMVYQLQMKVLKK